MPIALALSLVRAFGIPAALWIANKGVAELQRRGYQTTYLEALTRAVGVGINAAGNASVDPMSPEGMKIVGEAGAQYLIQNVGAAAQALDITTVEQHVERVLAQMGVMKAQVWTATAGVQKNINDVIADAAAKISPQLATDESATSLHG